MPIFQAQVQPGHHTQPVECPLRTANVHHANHLRCRPWHLACHPQRHRTQAMPQANVVAHLHVQNVQGRTRQKQRLGIKQITGTTLGKGQQRRRHHGGPENIQAQHRQLIGAHHQHRAHGVNAQSRPAAVPVFDLPVIDLAQRRDQLG